MVILEQYRNELENILQKNSAVKRFYIDGRQAAESPVMRISQEPWRFDVEIPQDAYRINLVCMDAGTRNILDYGNWTDAGFVTKPNSDSTNNKELITNH